MKRAAGVRGPLRVRGRSFEWGSRTYLMGIVNATPDSFSGDGLLGEGRGGRAAHAAAAVRLAARMVEEGADLLDVGGESTRPGHAPISVAEELRRIVPVIEAIRRSLPEVPISVDTTKRAVALAALDVGADFLNDIWGVSPESEIPRVAAERGVPIVLMHNRREPRYANVVDEVVADLRAAIERATRLGVPAERIIVDPGIGFGKTADHNLVLLRGLGALRQLGPPILLGTSRKSTIGHVLDLPPAERLEGTLATTALGIAAGVDIVRVHDVEPNRRTARMSDAIVRGSAGEVARR